jgi:hypothetical protein
VVAMLSVKSSLIPVASLLATKPKVHLK